MRATCRLNDPTSSTSVATPGVEPRPLKISGTCPGCPLALGPHHRGLPGMLGRFTLCRAGLPSERCICAACWADPGRPAVPAAPDVRNVTATPVSDVTRPKWYVTKVAGTAAEPNQLVTYLSQIDRAGRRHRWLLSKTGPPTDRTKKPPTHANHNNSDPQAEHLETDVGA